MDKRIIVILKSEEALADTGSDKIGHMNLAIDVEGEINLGKAAQAMAQATLTIFQQVVATHDPACDCVMLKMAKRYVEDLEKLYKEAITNI